MESQEYADKVALHAGNHEYDKLDTDSETFSKVFTKKKLASTLGNGVERRFIGVGTFDSVDTGVVTNGVEELHEIGKKNVSVESAGGLASMPLMPVFISESIDDSVKSTVKDMDNSAGNSLRVPVLAEVGSGGMMSSGVDLTYPVPPRRNLPRRRAVKKFVKAICDV